MYPGRRFITLFLVIFLLASAVISAESFISYAEGRLTITRGGTVHDGEIGFALAKGDILQTGSDSLAVLELEDRGTLKLRSETQLVLTDLGESMEVSLVSGGLFSRIRKLAGRSYGVRAPNVVAAVRGTEFFTAYGRSIEDQPDLWLCVNEGAVEVALVDTGESVMVAEGEGINILGANRLTDPKFYSWTQDLNWNSDPAAGAVGDSTDLDGAYTDLRDFDYD